MSGWIAENLLASALLIALVLLVRAPVARLFGARAAFALWLAPLVRLLVPPVRVEAPTPDIWIETTQVAAQAVAPVRQALPVSALLLAVWVGGVTIFLGLHLLAYRRFVATALAKGRAPVMREGIAMIETPAVSGPAAAGLIKRRIFVPLDFADAFAPDEQDMALRHELLHHRRRDLWASAAALLVLALHWFNPLAYVAHRAFRRDLEAACDADLLAQTAPVERAAYARAIVKCAAGPIPQPVCALTDTDELKGRLKMMTLKHGAGQRLAGATFAAAIALGGLLLALPAVAQTTPQGPKEETTRTEVRKVIIEGPDGKRHESEISRTMVDEKKCDGEAFEATVESPSSAGKVERNKVFLCTRSGATKAETAAQLEKALNRIEKDSDFGSETKARIVAQLKAKIAELRAGK